MDDVTALVSFVSPLGVVLIMVVLGWRAFDRLVVVVDKHADQLWNRIDRWLDAKENGRIQ